MSNNNWNLQNSYTNLPPLFYHKHFPTPAPNPKPVIYNCKLARELGLSTNPDTANLSGQQTPENATPICQAYAGYQFGHFAMLGDGRAILLGEQITPDGKIFDIQLKGSGPTPFSRNGDGYAALAPMLREYIVSEAMHYLGIPTTRSLAVVLTGNDVIRDKILPGAILTRVASSHIRVGTFNYAAAFGSHDDVRALADYSIARHYSNLSEENAKIRYAMFLREVVEKQASLITQWQLTGFIHGVMNTDNMAISGETIDYGPCAFMDAYNPDTVFSSIDTMGRYAYKNQPAIGAWNLSRFAEALLPLLDNDKSIAMEVANSAIEFYWKRYDENWHKGMCAKLGLTNSDTKDTDLITELLNLMTEHKLDHTNTFRALTLEQISALPKEAQFMSWYKKWLARKPSHQLMKTHNPAVIPRNHRVEEALSAAEEGDFTVMQNLLAALSNPYEDSDKYSQPPEASSCEYKTFCGT